MIMQQRFRTNDGQIIWTECSLNNLTHDPFVKALIVNVRNITERVDQEQQQEDFIHMASHELKNPITAIKGFLQLLKRRIKKENNTEFENLLDRIEGQTEKVLNMTAEMLNITKIKAGELQYHFEIIDLNDCLKEAVEALQATTTSHQLQLIIPAETVMVWADKTRIGQVVTNLINNAIKYSPNRDLVSVEASYDTMQVRVGVKDFGIGIPKDKQQRIFDRFYRVDTLPKGQFQGLGLGLFIASEIVRRHHGYIGVESEEGRGSTFWFTLPLRPD
jgi:signal transduction histidine kinase